MPEKRILVIDDEEAIQTVIQECLKELANWEILTAGSGIEGLLIAESQLPDGILLDLSMPEMDGFDILQKLQQNPVTRRIPVALLTARVEPADQAQFSRLGVAVIKKPFNLLTLVNQITEAFDWNY